MKPSKNKSLVLVGDGYTAEIAHAYFTHDSPYRVAGFAVERAYLKRDKLYDLPVVALEDMEQHFPAKEHHAFVALSFGKLNYVRARLYEATRRKGYAMASYIHSSARIATNVSMGDNLFILEQVAVQPFAKLGNDVFLWAGSIIAHHSEISDHAFLASNVTVSGFCNIGEHSFLGAGVSLADRVTIGRDNFIGLGMRVTHSTEDDTLLLPPPQNPAQRSARNYCKVDA